MTATITRFVLATCLLLPAVVHAVVPGISASDSHTLALDANGQVTAWGSDSIGQLGQGRSVFRTSPAPLAGLPAMKQVVVDRHALALDTTGQVWSWGESCYNSLGPRAEANAAKPARVTGMTNVVAIAVGYCWSAVAKADGTVWHWGLVPNNAFDFSVRQVPGMSSVVQVAIGDSHILARRSDGRVYAYGGNTTGQLGLGLGNGFYQPTLIPSIPVGGVIDIGAGGDLSWAIRSDGMPLRWGGIFGNVYTPPLNVPTALTGLGGNAVSMTWTQVNPQVVRADGTVWIYQLTSTPAAWVPFSGFTGMTSIDEGSLVTVGVDTSGRVAASGSNNLGQLGQGNTTDMGGVFLVPGMTNTKEVHVAKGGGGSVLALKHDGTVWFWGGNPLGQGADGGIVRSSVPVPVTIPATIKQVSANRGYSLALDTSGTVWGWGDNLGQFDSTLVPRTTPATIAGIANVQMIAAGDGFSMFLKADGTVWVSGSANVDTTGSGAVRQVVSLTSITKIAAGQNGHAIDVLGRLYSFGINQSGQYGNGTTTYSPTPVQVISPGFNLSPVVAVSEGERFAPVGAVTGDGKAWMWANKFSCCLGNGNNTVFLTPQQVPGITDAVDISVGTQGTLIRRSNGAVTAIGFGQLLDAATQPLSPYSIAFNESVQAVSTGGERGFLVGASGVVWGFGQSTSEIRGTVGDGAYVPRRAPSVVFSPNGAGTLDGNNWFLDLAPAAANAIPPAAVPGAIAVATASGSNDGVGLSSLIKYKTADLGKRVNNYVLALVPPEFFDQVSAAPGRSDTHALGAKAAKAGGFVLAQLTPAGWVDVTGQLIAYSSGVANAAGGATNILNGINGTLIPGSRFCVGYGESGQSMLTSAALREVLLLPGTAATASGVPCVLSGVYVDGPATSLQGTNVTFNASVIGLSPTGTVNFRDGFASLGSVALSTSNPAVAKASIATSSLAVGPHSIGAGYSGDAQNAATTTAIPLLHTVGAPIVGTQTTLSGPASALLGAEVAFSATVTGNAPSGTVQFRDGAGNLGAAIALVDGTATLRVSSLGLGSHALSAVYSGDGNNTGSTSNALDHLVANTIGTAVTLTISTNAPKVGTPVTLTANVAGTSPTGTVQFQDNGQPLGNPVALASAQAAMTTTGLAAGTHVITARYSGDGDDPQATSPARVIDVTLEIDPAQAAIDTDGDGLSNALEAVEGRNPLIKDNDIFSSPRLFGMQQYRDFLGREGDAGGIAFWTSQVGPMSRGQVIESFFISPEFQGVIAPVARLYFAYFLRIPDYDGLNFWIGYYRSGNSLEAISNFFAGSAEFQSTYGALDNAQFVNLVYQNVLGRAPDSGGFAFWKGQLDNGIRTRGQVMLGFSESDEYRQTSDSEVFVTMMYIGMMRRAPDSGGFSFWVQYRDNGNPGLALIDGFLNSPEYHGRFLP